MQKEQKEENEVESRRRGRKWRKRMRRWHPWSNIFEKTCVKQNLKNFCTLSLLTVGFENILEDMLQIF